MERIIKIGRSFYAIALVVYGLLQFIYADFRPVFVPAWQSALPALPVWAYLFGILLLAVGAAILFEKKAREASLLLGGIFLLLFCLVHIPFEIIADPNSKHLALWANALKELALSGGAFVIAGTFREAITIAQKKSLLIALLEKLIPFGRIFFSITMVSFGIVHFQYAANVATLVPAWLPYSIFWTYLAGVALVGAGVAIILKIRIREIGTLLGIMIFLWIILLHIPRAIATPFENRANEFASAFDALAFTGIALVIAFGSYMKKEELS